jgi:hypothetical protein
VPRPQDVISNAIPNSVLSTQCQRFPSVMLRISTLRLPLYRVTSAPPQVPYAAPLSEPDPAFDFEEALITANDALMH